MLSLKIWVMMRKKKRSILTVLDDMMLGLNGVKNASTKTNVKIKWDCIVGSAVNVKVPININLM